MRTFPYYGAVSRSSCEFLVTELVISKDAELTQLWSAHRERIEKRNPKANHTAIDTKATIKMDRTGSKVNVAHEKCELAMWTPDEKYLVTVHPENSIKISTVKNLIVSEYKSIQLIIFHQSLLMSGNISWLLGPVKVKLLFGRRKPTNKYIEQKSTILMVQSTFQSTIFLSNSARLENPWQ